METKEGFVAGFPSEIIREGKVQVLVPRLDAYGVVPSDYAPSKAPVFYNPIMEFNRDLTVLAFKAYQHIVNHPISICEPFTSQGIRGIRFAAEIDAVDRVLLSDINNSAYELAKYNIELNHVQNKIKIENKDANCILSCNASPKKRFDIVDIDPFGTPVPYLDSAIMALRNKGLLAITATDLAPLCGVHAKACVRKYGGRPLRTEYCHELAIRLLAGHLASTAAKHDVGVRLLFSHSSDHYIRAYAQIGYGCQKADESLKQTGYVLHCFNCMHREMIGKIFAKTDVCPECGDKMDYAGPLWIDAISDPAFIELMLKENKETALKNNLKITKILNLTRDEATAPATYYVIDKLSGKIKSVAPSNQAFLEALHKNGFRAVLTHFNPRGIKTEAHALTMQKLLREIVASK
jgi:tRNA (guanine26-N2/guanine27-N2)-dimethyltransferase